MIHDLKIAPQWFTAYLDGEKTFEIRINDRPFGVGDTLKLREFDIMRGGYTGRTIERKVVGVLHGPAYGLAEGFCIMSVVPTESSASVWKESRFTPPHTDVPVLGRRALPSHCGVGTTYRYAEVVRRSAGFGKWEWETENGRVPLSYYPEWMEIPA